MSPVVGLYVDETRRAAAVLEAVCQRGPAVDLTDGDGVRHRLWPLTDDPAGDASSVTTLVAAASPGPITIADGHHRYETALRYRDERRMTRSCEEDPAWDYLLALLLESTSQPLTVLPTHRVVAGLGQDGHALLARAAELFDVREIAPADLVETFDTAAVAPAAGGRGRFGLVTREGAALLAARPEAFAQILPTGGPALRGLDVVLLAAALERLCAVDAETVAAGQRVRYTKSAHEAAEWVSNGTDGADAAFLLEPTPVAAIEAVAGEGEVMPQKSTYFYPKALTGLVINPHEW